MRAISDGLRLRQPGKAVGTERRPEGLMQPTSGGFRVRVEFLFREWDLATTPELHGL